MSISLPFPFWNSNLAFHAPRTPTLHLVKAIEPPSAESVDHVIKVLDSLQALARAYHELASAELELAAKR